MTNKNDRIPIDKSGKPVQMPRIRKVAVERQPLCSQDVSATRKDGGLDTTSPVTRSRSNQKPLCGYGSSEDPNAEPMQARF
jgi:hypothetical protein